MAAPGGYGQRVGPQSFTNQNETDWLRRRLNEIQSGYVQLFFHLPVFANNAAALAGGLKVGMLYRTGADPDPVCIVH